MPITESYPGAGTYLYLARNNILCPYFGSITQASSTSKAEEKSKQPPSELPRKSTPSLKSLPLRSAASHKMSVISMFVRACPCYQVTPTRDHTINQDSRTSAQTSVVLKSSLLCAVLDTRNMNVILREDVEGRGYKGEEVVVRGGYMRNFLFPTKKAVYATNENRALYQSVQKVRYYSRRLEVVRASSSGSLNV